jgi:PAS domain-containing protein
MGSEHRSVHSAERAGVTVMNQKRLDALERSRSFLLRVASRSDLDVSFDHLPDVGFFVKDAQGRVMHVNRAFLELVNVNVEDDVIRGSRPRFLPPEFGGKLQPRRPERDQL